MKSRILLIAIACISFNMVNAQSSINDYKYVIVEDQFNFQNEPGEYNLNGLVHFLLRKHGFTAIIEGQKLPADLKANFCLALRADVTAKGALRTKATIILKDCESNEVYRSGEGITKEKDFARAYDLAIRKAFDTFQGLNYAYKPNQNIIEKGRPEEVIEVVEEAKKEIEELKAEIKELKEENEEEKNEFNTKELDNDNDKEDSVKTLVVEDVEEEKIPIIDPEFLKSDGVKQLFANKIIKNKSIIGYELLEENKSIMEIYYSGLEDTFIVKGKDALLFKKNNFWVYIENNGKSNQAKVFEIKF